MKVVLATAAVLIAATFSSAAQAPANGHALPWEEDFTEEEV